MDGPLVSQLGDGPATLISLLGLPPKSTAVDFTRSHPTGLIRLADVYDGLNTYVSMTASELFTQTQNGRILSLVSIEERPGSKFSWKVKTPITTLMDPNPVGALPSTARRAEYELSVVLMRWEKQVEFDVEALTTQDGRVDAYGAMKQLYTIMLDTMEHLAIMAIVKVADVYDVFPYKKFNNIKEAFVKRKREYDCIRKEPSGRGFSAAIDDARRDMGRYVPTHVLIPEGTESLITSGPGHQDYYLHGPGAAGNVKNGMENAQSVAGKIQLIPVRFINTNHALADPLSQVVEHGDFARISAAFFMDLNVDYVSAMGNVQMLSMRDPALDWETIQQKDMIRNNGRFTSDGSLRHTDADYQAYNQIKKNVHLGDVRNETIDLFACHSPDGSKRQACKTIGDMDVSNLPLKAVQYLARCFNKNFVNQAEIVRGINEGRTAIQAMDNATWADHHKVLSALSSSSLNEFGHHNLPSEIAGYTAASGVPAGYGSGTGLMTLAKLDSASPLGQQVGAETLAAARNFSTAVQNLHSQMVALLPDNHPFVTGELIAPHERVPGLSGEAQKRAHSLISFANAIVVGRQHPIVANANSAGAGSAAHKFAGAVAVEDASPTETAIVNSIRGTLNSASAVHPAVVAALKDSAAVEEFRAKYSTAKLSNSFARYVGSKPDGGKESARGNRTFGLFAQHALTDLLQTSSPDQVNTFMANLVSAVDADQAIRASDMDSVLASWKTDAAGGGGSGASGRGGARVTPLVAHPRILAEAKDDSIALLHHTGKLYNSAVHVPVVPGSAESIYGFAGAQASQQMKKALDAANSSGEISVMRLSMLVILGAKLHVKTFDRFEELNVPLPFGHLLFRFARTYEGQSLETISASSLEKPVKLIYHSLLSWTSRSAYSKLMEVKSSMYMNAAMTEPERRKKITAGFITGYLHGDNTRLYDAAKFKGHLSKHTGGASILAVAVPIMSVYGPEQVDNVLDIRGHFERKMIRDLITETEEDHYYHSLTYPSAVMSAHAANLHRLVPADYDKKYDANDVANYDNTIVHQGHQRIFRPDIGWYRPDLQVEEYFGPNVHPGDGVMRTTKETKFYRKLQ